MFDYVFFDLFVIVIVFSVFDKCYVYLDFIGIGSFLCEDVFYFDGLDYGF